MKRLHSRRQRGVALIGILAVLAIGATAYLIKQLNVDSGGIDAVRKNRNAEVLNRAKQALIGYIAAQAAKDGENRPGALPCPEAAANFNDPANEGTISYPCTLPKVGRFPWRSLGLDKLVDASGEPLWYAVATGWAGADTIINSNCATYNIPGFACSTGRLTVDGATDDVIALIVAPGPAFNVAASGSCGAWSQSRPTSGTLDWRNYLECENATYPMPDATFVTTGPNGSFNDQVMKITAAEIMPAIEAAIAHRIEREIVPVLQTVYTPAGWGFGGTKPVYPYAAPFADPSTSGMGGATSTVHGVPPILLSSGLLPLVKSETFPGARVACAAGAAAPLCQPDFVAWTAPAIAGTGMTNPNCTATAGATLTCNFSRTCFVTCLGATNHNYTITATASNVGMALRQKSIDVTKMTNVGAAPVQTFGALNSVGSLPFSISGTVTSAAGAGISGLLGGLLCGGPLGFLMVCKTETITIPMNAVLVDHPLLDSRTSSSTGWYLRNKWHEVTYYGVVQGHTPAAIATTPGCVDSPAPVTCLSATNVLPANKLRAFLILAGRSINGSTRPSSVLADYLEFGNAKTTSAAYERQTVTPAPRTSYVDSGVVPNAYVLAAASPVGGRTFQFKATAANTGASTLTTPATGSKDLVNADGSDLASATIHANAAVQVDYDGSQFVLSKRPFNDRIVVIDANP